MKNNKIEINFQKYNDTKSNIIKKDITNERKMEILNQLENGLKTKNEIDLKTKNENEQEETDCPCPIACKTELTYENFVDHIMECEKIIEDCYKCGNEYMANVFIGILQFTQKQRKDFHVWNA